VVCRLAPISSSEAYTRATLSIQGTLLPDITTGYKIFTTSLSGGMPSTSFDGRESLLQLLGTHTETKRDNLPRIGGSFGGFLAVIICLSLIVIVSCIGIFFLLRDQRANDEAQTRRSKRSRYASAPGSHIPAYDLERTYPHRPLSTRLAVMFGRPDTQKNTGLNINRGNTDGGATHGWVRAGSSDEWEADRAEGVATLLSVREVVSPSPLSARSTPPPSPTPVSRTTSESTSSVRYDLHAVRGLSYPERHISTHSTLPNIHSQLSSPSHSPASSPVPLRTLSPESVPEGLPLDSDIRQYLTPSGVVMRTMRGGTKFIEAL